MSRRAFTLPELLVVLALVAGLTLLVLPSLGGARYGAREAVSLSNLRQHGVVVLAYQNDWDEVFPYFTDPRATETIIRFHDGRASRRLRYFDAWFGWSDAIGPEYYGRYDDPTFASPFERPLAYGTHYWYSCSLICRPEYWNTRTRLDGRSQWRPTRAHECVHPSQKAVYVDITPFNYDIEEAFNQLRPIRMGFVDGSAARLTWSQAHYGYPNGDGDIASSVHIGPSAPGTHTIDGVRGRDR